MRFFYSAVVFVSMFHLYLVGSDLACASHSSPAGTMSMSSHHGHGDAHGNSASASGSEECATPVQQRCCEAMSGCGVVSLSVGRERDGAADWTNSTTAVRVAVLATAAHGGPEPPPPKA